MIIGLTGLTGSGKTTLSKQLKEHLSNSYDVISLCQDDFYKDKGFINVGGYDNWDHPSAFDLEKLKDQIKLEKLKGPNSLIIVDGILLLHDKELLSMFDKVYFLEISEDTCRNRRFNRDEWLRDNPEYFNLCIKPCHEEYGHYKIAEGDSKEKIIILNGELPTEVLVGQVENTIKSC